MSVTVRLGLRNGVNARMALKAVANGIFAETYGSWPPRVVALHGWGRRGKDFDGVLSGLDAVAVDLPGFGASPPPSAPTGARGYAASLRPFLAELPGRPLLVGHSFGGRVAVCLAAEGLCEGLVLTGVPLLRRDPVRTPPIAYRVMKWANRIGVVSDRRLEAQRRRRGSADYRATTGVMRDVLVTTVNETYEAEMARVEVPVSMVWGEDDTEVPPAIAQRAIPLFTKTKADLQIVAGAGHLVPTSAPDALRAAIELQLAT